MSSLQDLLAKRAALEQEIEATQKRERQDAIAKVKSIMAEYGLTVADLSTKGAAPKAGVGKGTKVAPKYRNSATGETWSGRGLQPNWLKAAIASGKKLDDFAL
ncbi:H-NS histone family protein [Piscinibacter gummiphilus]|uniref:H-NS histone family protein n=1 Tax=Piscinibacter gummiphilus TaxID=946333 RepID=A0ABZ0D1U9_9BURK|nr:H-NS histone family protein [Piscinibacter gummiphilus]WOB10731.1 H-NS histone family protein [Piscinibacter gummiphilus]